MEEVHCQGKGISAPSPLEAGKWMMNQKRDYKNDLPSLKRQNLNLLKEREVLRDEVRILTEEREDRCKKLQEMWSDMTDIKRFVEMVIEVKVGDRDWDGLVDTIESLVTSYVRLDVSEQKLNDRISDIRRELTAEQAKSVWTRIKERLFR